MTPGASIVEVRDAELPRDRNAVERLWLAYLSWGNDEMEARHGFRLPVREAVERDLGTIEKFQPPAGRIVLAFTGGHACGIGCLQRIGTDTAEIKRMFVEPSFRRAGLGRAILEHLMAAAQGAGYARLRLDSPDFMSAAHAITGATVLSTSSHMRRVRSPTSTNRTGSSWSGAPRSVRAALAASDRERRSLTGDDPGVSAADSSARGRRPHIDSGNTACRWREQCGRAIRNAIVRNGSAGSALRCSEPTMASCRRPAFSSASQPQMPPGVRCWWQAT